MKKKLKFFSLLSISLATISLPLLFTKYNEPKQTLWYKTNDFSSKLEIRQPFIKSSTNNENLIKNSNNDFELKLLLNPNFISLDSQKIHQFSLNFIKKILETNIKIKSYVVSDFLPMVWFYFNNEKEREIFVKKILDSKEIFKFILFENNNLSKLSIHSTYEDEYDDEYDEDYSENLVDDFPGGDENKNKFYSELNKNFSIVNLDKNKINKNVYPGLKSNNIGILEVTSIKRPNFFDNRFQNYFSKGINVTDPFSNQLRNQYKSHSTFVSMIAGGKCGADNDAKIFLSHFNTDAEWTKSIEDMVKNNVRIINHSYGVGEVTNLINYNDNSLFLDYISRKFGVINVLSSGNGENDDTLNSYITDSKLSFNSIVVGALKSFSTPKSRSKNLIAPYSNYRLTDELKDISKPLVVAPGHYWNPTIIYNNHSYGGFREGTSYASPLVAGLISDLLKIKPEINKNDEFRIPMVKSIISASSLTPQLDDLKFKTSGFEKKYGSGIIDFDAMTQASNNVSTVTIPYNDDRKIVFTSNDIYLKPKQTIKISSSWLYNAGILKNSENKPEYNNNVNWWYALFIIPGIIMNILEKQRIENWVETHKNEDPKRLTLEESKKRQNNKIFSDYDLVLEKFDGNSWKEIKRIYTTNTNDELIEYKTLLGGWFRFKVIKASSALFENSLDDKLAVTYLVKNEN